MNKIGTLYLPRRKEITMIKIDVYDSESKRIKAAAEAIDIEIPELIADFMDSFDEWLKNSISYPEYEKYKRILEESI